MEAGKKRLAGDTARAANTDEVKEILEKSQNALVKITPPLRTSEFRFWRFQASVVFTAITILKKMGLLDINRKDFLLWIHNHFKRAHLEFTRTYKLDFKEAFAEFIASIQEQTIVTYGYAMDPPVEPLRPLRGTPVARVVLRLGNEKMQPGVTNCVIFKEKALKMWCAENRVDMGGMLRYIRKDCQGFFHRNFVIGQGTYYKGLVGRSIGVPLKVLDLKTKRTVASVVPNVVKMPTRAN